VSHPKTNGPDAPKAKRPDAKRPYHVGVAVGVATTVYAVTLVAASRLQLDADRGLIADRAPVQDALTLLDDHHDWLESRLGGARLQYAERADGYTAVTDRLTTLQARLASLDRSVAAVEKLGNSMSLTLSLPAVPVHRSQGSGNGGSASGGGTSKPPSAVRPPKPPPATSGSTGASGAP
jgi:hypothetical protein